MGLRTDYPESYDSARVNRIEELTSELVSLLHKEAYSRCPRCGYPPYDFNNTDGPRMQNCRDCGHSYLVK